MLKKTKVFTITCHEATPSNVPFYLDLSPDKKVLYKSNHNNKHLFPQHLYFTSPQEIQPGFKGWAIITVRDDCRIKYLEEIIVTEQLNFYTKEDRKFAREFYEALPIVGTTNKSLIKSKDCDCLATTYEGCSQCIELFSQPTESFINKYFVEYNKGHIIKEVNVKYELFREDVVKVNPKNNTFSTMNINKTYTYKEVMKFFSNLQHDMAQQVLKPEEFKKTIIPYEWAHENIT